MNLYCTQKVIDMLPTEVLREENVAGDQHWAANVIQVGHRKFLILMHTQSLYPMVFTGLTKKYFKNFDAHFADLIRANLKYENIRPEAIEIIVNELDAIRFVKITDKKMISQLSQWGSLIKQRYESSDDVGPDPEITGSICTHTMKLKDEGYIEPIKAWNQFLREHCDMELYKLRGVRLRIKLEGTKANVFRVITLPFEITYRQLHHTLLQLFSWPGDYYHMFEIVDKKNYEIQLIAPYNTTGESLDENLVRLSDLPFQNHRIRYIIGHKVFTVLTIEILGIFEGYNVNHPVFEFGEGLVGPEGVEAEIFESYLNNELTDLPYELEIWFRNRKEMAQKGYLDRHVNERFHRILQQVTPSYDLYNEQDYINDFYD